MSVSQSATRLVNRHKPRIWSCDSVALCMSRSFSELGGKINLIWFIIINIIIKQCLSAGESSWWIVGSFHRPFLLLQCWARRPVWGRHDSRAWAQILWNYQLLTSVQQVTVFSKPTSKVEDAEGFHWEGDARFLAKGWRQPVRWLHHDGRSQLGTESKLLWN